MSAPALPPASARVPHVYWDELWRGDALPAPIDPRLGDIANHANRRFDALFRRCFAGLGTANARLLEIGCARSAWLPYFRREFGFEIVGLDYSSTGCAKAAEILESAGVPGRIVEADFFDPPSDMQSAFDVVVSFGVIEHFDDTASALAACRAYLRPGGMAITIIPNLSGLLGVFQRRIDQKIYDMHLPLDREQFAEAHQRAGFDVESCAYFLSANWYVLRAQRFEGTFLHLPFRIVTGGLSRIIWGLERIGFRLPANSLTSPYVVCIARAPAASTAATITATA